MISEGTPSLGKYSGSILPRSDVRIECMATMHSAKIIRIIVELTDRGEKKS